MKYTRSFIRSETLGTITRLLALVVAGTIMGIGAVALVIPDAVITISEFMVSPAGLYAAAAFRGGCGLILVLAARCSRAPWILYAIGCVAIFMGFSVPLLGVERAMARINWEEEHLMFLRVEGALFILFGLIITSLVRPSRRGLSNVGHLYAEERGLGKL